MANLLTGMVDKIKVDVWGDMFVIAEITDGQITGNPGPGDPAPVAGPDIQAGPSGLILTSRIGSGFEHFVRYELWDARPDRFKPGTNSGSESCQSNPGRSLSQRWIPDGFPEDFLEKKGCPGLCGC